ncbi:MAG TPA: MarR family transcriptional regulator [Geminicoccaceae bacterium]|nr:MarR family transcriptional regulator [Geminicoccaceae bacterium]
MPIVAPNPLYLREAELDQGIDLLHAALDALNAEPDGLLAERGLGRGHHRALALIRRRPGTTLAELQAVLPLTKQTLSRLLRQLMELGLVDQKPGRRDRRQRLLELTEPGRELCERLDRLQRRRLAAACRAAGAEAVAGFREVLRGLVEDAGKPEQQEQQQQRRRRHAG